MQRICAIISTKNGKIGVGSMMIWKHKTGFFEIGYLSFSTYKLHLICNFKSSGKIMQNVTVG